MQLSFPSNKSVEMSFKMGIAGTSSSPQNVMVVLERNSKHLSFAAEKVGDVWTAHIDSPGAVFGAGEIKVSVNVMLNNRVFTPMKTTAEIIDAVENIPAEQIEALPQEPASQEEPKVEIPAVEVQPEEPKASPEEQKKVTLDLLSVAERDIAKPTFKPKVVPQKLNLLKSIEPGQPKKIEPVKESAVAKAPESVFKLRKTKIVFK